MKKLRFLVNIDGPRIQWAPTGPIGTGRQVPLLGRELNGFQRGTDNRVGRCMLSPDNGWKRAGTIVTILRTLRYARSVSSA